MSNIYHFTPEELASIMVDLVPIKNPKYIIDFCAGDGSLLKAARNKWVNAEIIGIDVKWTKGIIETLKTMNIKTIKSNSIALTSEFHKSISCENGYSLILANPPFNSRINLHLGKFSKIVHNPPKSAPIEMIFAILNIFYLNVNGYIAIILPSSVISSIKGQWLRDYITEQLEIKYIVDLSRNIFKNADAKLHLIVGQKKINNKEYYTRLSYLDDNYNYIEKGIVSNEELKCRMDVSYHLNNEIYILKDYDLITSHISKPIKRGYSQYGIKRVFVSENNCSIPYIHTSNLTKDGLKVFSDRYIVIDGPMFNKNSLLEKGDILVARVGNGCVGRSAIVWHEKEMGIASDCIFILRPNNLIISILLYAFFQTKFVINYLRVISAGTGALSISKFRLENIHVLKFTKQEEWIAQKCLGFKDLPKNLIYDIQCLIENRISLKNKVISF